MGKNSADEVNLTPAELSNGIKALYKHVIVPRYKKTECFVTGRDVPAGDCLTIIYDGWNSHLKRRTVCKEMAAVITYIVAKEYLKPKVRKQIEDLILAGKL